METADKIRTGEYPVRKIYPNAATLQVGPDKPYKTPAAALADAKPGDVIEIDAGDYHNANALLLLECDDITLRGVGGRANMIVSPDYRVMWGQGIWVIYGNGVQIENIGFIGARTDDSASGVRVNAYGCIFKIKRFNGCSDTAILVRQ